jgi:hypothetical protein
MVVVMGTRERIFRLVIGSAAVLAWARVAGAETYGFKGPLQRRIQITREYNVPAAKGQKTEVGIPALMSFWGATNQQVIQSSKFTYSVKPDKIEITADNMGMRRRNYELTWDAPDTNRIKVTQVLVVELKCRNQLSTAARLPYPKDVLERCASSLGTDKGEGISTDNPGLEKICATIKSRGRYAEDVVEDVCDWINENIKFKLSREPSSDQVLARRQGQCSGMARLACAILRKMGVPAETVSGKFIGGEGSHGYMEVYFPDAGWVFYDLSNLQRGIKTLNCVVTAGFSFRVRTPKKFQWVNGHFFKTKDLTPYPKKMNFSKKALRKGPKGMPVLGVKVNRRKPMSSVKIRHVPIRRLIMDLSIPPGKREYVSRSLQDAAKKQTGPAKEAPAASEKDIAKDCAQLFTSAVQSKMNNDPDKAREYLQKIIDKYPGTEFAEKAKELQKTM